MITTHLLLRRPAKLRLPVRVVHIAGPWKHRRPRRAILTRILLPLHMATINPLRLAIALVRRRHPAMLGHAVVRLRRTHGLLRHRRRLTGRRRTLRRATGRVLARYYIDEEVKHVGLGEGGGDVAALQGAPFVVFRVDPGAHREFGDEDVAAFGEEDGRLGADHFYFRVCFHNFLDACEGELVDFEIMGLRFKVVDCLLPIGGEDVAGGSGEALVDLDGDGLGG